MTYVDGYVVAVPRAKKAEYLTMAEASGKVFKACGALSVMESWGDDVPDGKVTSFPMAVQLKEDETVVLSWVIWPDKATREKGMAIAEKDPVFQGEGAMPFDGARMIYGSFETILDL